MTIPLRNKPASERIRLRKWTFWTRRCSPPPGGGGLPAAMRPIMTQSSNEQRLRTAAPIRAQIQHSKFRIRQGRRGRLSIHSDSGCSLRSARLRQEGAAGLRRAEAAARSVLSDRNTTAASSPFSPSDPEWPRMALPPSPTTTSEKEVPAPPTGGTGTAQYPGKCYTSPEKPMKAMARIPAVISAMGTPLKAAGTSSKSRRSRRPAKRTSASPKPMAVETE